MSGRSTPQVGWRRYLPRPPALVGKRGQIMSAFGVGWVLIGLAVNDDWAAGIFAPHLLIPPAVRAFLWIFTGVLAIVSAWRPVGYTDAFAWAGLYVMPAVRCISYFISWVDYMLPWGSIGYVNGWLFSGVYATIVSLVWICSGWPDVVLTPDPPASRRE